MSGGFDQRGPGPGTGSSPAHRGAATPGKTTLIAAALPRTTHDFAAAPVQLAAREHGPSGPARLDSGAVQETAAAGVAGAGGSLPHGHIIQQLFGRHDVSGINAHVGGAAATASRAIGAEAYATGHNVAFASTPSLHTAAHEAAHVVQQRGGVQLKGGVGESGDAHEQHANAVADSVVQGKSAERLLDRYAGDATSGAVRSAGVQRFGSQEHQSLGDTATGGASYDVGGAPDDHFQLTHGDIIALSGDYFLAGPGTTTAGGRGAQDDLFALAGRPGNRGGVAGTRDEIIYTLKLIRGDDARFKPGGAWATFVFSETVIAAVDERYKRLAAANTTHFAAPRGRDAAGAPNPSPEGSAGSSYRSTHEAALRMAFQAGQSHAPTDRALAMEAAAQHYLTDAFSAGHLRTPIGDLREYWKQKYPLFWYNVRHKIALDTAVRLNAQSTNLSTIVGTVNQMYEAISQTVEAMASSLPPITLGDLLSKIFHDQDNAAGLNVEGGGRMYGDGNLDNPDPNNRTRASAQGAIRDGIADVQTAYTLGGQMTGAPVVSDADIFGQVRMSTRTGDRYLAETRMPVPLATEPAQNWKAASLEALWDQSVTGATGPTIGAKVIEALQPGHEIRDTLEELSLKFPTNDSRWSGDLHPRQAYRDGFLTPLIADPRTGLFQIINWAPNYGLASSSRDDQSLASGKQLDDSHQLEGMTTPARVAYINELLDGHTGDDEAALVVRIFETAAAGERRAMYRQIEGHDWTGDFKHGLLVSDDKLWNSLSKSQLDQLRGIING